MHSFQCIDARDYLAMVPDNAFNLQFTSPPYNIGKEYESKVSIEEYLQFHKIIINEMVRVCHPTGSICWQVGNFVERSSLSTFYSIPYLKNAV